MEMKKFIQSAAISRSLRNDWSAKVALITIIPPFKCHKNELSKWLSNFQYQFKASQNSLTCLCIVISSKKLIKGLHCSDPARFIA